MSDSEVIKEKNDSEGASRFGCPDDVTSLFGAIGMKNFKVSAWLFILYILINSDVFIERILSDKNNTYADGRHATSAGVMLQGLILAVSYIIINSLVAADLI